MPASAAGSKRAIFRQVCELIPSYLVPKPARKHGISARDITPWSHVVPGPTRLRLDNPIIQSLLFRTESRFGALGAVTVAGNAT